jgi:hypothetical protein
MSHFKSSRVYNMFEKYKYPDNNMVCNLYKYHKKKINNYDNCLNIK